MYLCETKALRKTVCQESVPIGIHTSAAPVLPEPGRLSPSREVSYESKPAAERQILTNESFLYLLIKTTYKTREKQSKPKSDTSKRGVRLPQTKTQTYSLIYENKFPKQNFRNASFG